MKIGIDGTPLTIPFPCGSKNYATWLISALAKIDKKNNYFVFSKIKVSLPKQKNFRLVKIPNVFPILKRQLLFPYLVKKQKLDVFHFLEPYGVVVRIHPKTITTVHDYNLNYTYPFWKFPFERINTEVFRFFTLKNSKFLITNTNAIKTELSGHVKATDIVTIPEAASKDFKTINVPASNRAKFILAMGDFAPRKNITGVIKAYSLLPEKFRETYKLKIVASTIQSGQNFKKMAQELSLQNQIKVLENIPTKKLVALYNQAACFVYPSLYEGFSLPILEAFACGCPVITSNYGAMKEVAGTAAYLVNPKSAREIFKAINRLVDDNALTNTLRRKGLKRAKQFSWIKTARETLELYRRVYSSS